MIPAAVRADLEALGADPQAFERWCEALAGVVAGMANEATSRGDDSRTLDAALFWVAAGRMSNLVGYKGATARVAQETFYRLNQLGESKGEP